MTALIVGGGAVLFGEHLTLRGVSSVVRPQLAAVANAIGAALAQVINSWSFDSF